MKTNEPLKKALLEQVAQEVDGVNPSDQTAHPVKNMVY